MERHQQWVLKPFSNGQWSHKANQGPCSCLLSTFSPSFDVLLGCSTYDPTLLGNIALKFVFYPGQSGTPTCRACDGVTCPHLHLLSPPTILWMFYLGVPLFSGTVGLLPRARVGFPHPGLWWGHSGQAVIGVTVTEAPCNQLAGQPQCNTNTETPCKPQCNALTPSPLCRSCTE